MKLCKDCAHHEERLGPTYFCRRPVGQPVTDPATGKTHQKRRFIDCHIERMFYNLGGMIFFGLARLWRCGPDARYFEPRSARVPTNPYEAEALSGKERVDAVRAGKPDFRGSNAM